MLICLQKSQNSPAEEGGARDIVTSPSTAIDREALLSKALSVSAKLDGEADLTKKRNRLPDLVAGSPEQSLKASSMPGNKPAPRAQPSYWFIVLRVVGSMASHGRITGIMHDAVVAT